MKGSLFLFAVLVLAVAIVIGGVLLVMMAFAFDLEAPSAARNLMILVILPVFSLCISAVVLRTVVRMRTRSVRKQVEKEAVIRTAAEAVAPLAWQVNHAIATEKCGVVID